MHDVPVAGDREHGSAHDSGVVIIGGGHAGLQLADSLRGEGHQGAITVVASEPGLPYQRPPLSKDYLVGKGTAVPVPLRGSGFYDEHRIDLRAGCTATGIDRERRTVSLDSGDILSYGHLVFATGASTRTLRCPGADLLGVHCLGTLNDAERLQEALGNARRVVVIGAGFIGLEFAAVAHQRGLDVVVLGQASRPMARSLSPAMSHWVASAHRDLGIDLRLGLSVDRIEGRGGSVAAVISSCGERFEADLVVYGIGADANTALALNSGLEVNDGIVVDAALRTSDPAILAIGDCASFPNHHTGTRTRLESVQNATDHGRHAARTIMGNISPYADAPWFWSVQGSLRLQIAGISAQHDQTVVRGDTASGKFSVFCFQEARLLAVESVNSPADHMAARRLIAGALPLTPEQAVDQNFDIKAHSKAATAAA